jgi:cellulose synthase/poly-beta-1,6-N-acetylglucosamine synthase-like glycosyltransferase
VGLWIALKESALEILLVLYFISLFPFALYGLHRLDLLTRLLRRPRRTAASPGGEWPRVTVQLPVFNEGNVVERLIRSVAELDYPRDRLQIQVLDDSTDDTPTVVSRTLDDLPPDLDIVHLRRRVRSGFKAGALAHGLVGVPERGVLRSHRGPDRARQRALRAGARGVAAERVILQLQRHRRHLASIDH